MEIYYSFKKKYFLSVRKKRIFGEVYLKGLLNNVRHRLHIHERKGN